MIDANWLDARRILTVRLDNLGDVLLATPAIRALKTTFPHASIDLLTSPVGAQVGRLNPDISEVLVYEAPWVDPWQNQPHDAERQLAMINRLSEREYDAAVIFTSFRQSSLPAALMCYLAGIPLRLAASIDASGSLLTTRHRHPDIQMHEVQRGLDLVAAIGVRPADKHLVLTVPQDARERIRPIRNGQGNVTRSASPLIVVHPGCSMPARRFPTEQFAGIVDALVEQLGARVLLTGVAAERDLVAEVVSGLRPETRPAVESLAGRLEFTDFCALIESADLVVTNNTGPMHMAAATGTPVVALFALTNAPEEWGPWMVPHRMLFHDVPCRICNTRICLNGQACLRPITAADVVAAAESLGIRAGRRVESTARGLSVSLAAGG